MKKTLLILPVAAVVLTGCVAYQPSPTAGQYGYTYDYQIPVAEHIPAPVFGTVTEPRRTAIVTPAPGVPVVADLPPPPSTPPIYSEIPDMTPREKVIEKQTTVYVPQGPTVVNEAAGAQRGGAQAGAQGQPGVAPGYGGGSPAIASVYGGAVPLAGTNITTNITTNTVGGTNVSTNGLVGGGITNQVGVTNQVNVTNAFNVARGTNINEAAGAQPTNSVPDRLEPAPRLPEQPSIAPGTDDPASAPTPDTVAPQGAQAPQAGQLQAPATAPAPTPGQAPIKPAFTPVQPTGQQAPAPVQPQ